MSLPAFLNAPALIRIASHYPRAVVVLWGLGLAMSVAVIADRAGHAFTTAVERYDDSDSTRAQELLRQRFPERTASEQPNEVLVLRSESLTVDQPAFREHAQAVADSLLALGDGVIAGGSSYFLTGDETLVSADRHTTIVPLVVRDAARQIALVRRAATIAGKTGDMRAYLVGRASVGSDYKALAEHDLKAELRIGLPVALVILLIVFSTVVAALIPLVIAIASILVTLAILMLGGTAFQAYFLATNMVIMIGLAVGIDYALFMLSRYREEREGGHEAPVALARMGQTAGRAVLISGATVMLALLGLLIIPTNVFRSLAAGAILVVMVTMLAAFSLLPALVRLLGDRLEALRLPLSRIAPRGGAWLGLTLWTTRHPVAGLVLAAVLLIGLALPALDMKTGFSGIEALPERIGSRQGFQILEREFRANTISEAVIVIDSAANTPAVQAAVKQLRAALSTDTAFVADRMRIQTNTAGTLAVLSVPMVGDAESSTAQAGVHRLRDEHIVRTFSGVPAKVWVAGAAAGYIDFFGLTDRFTPIVFALVLSLSFVLMAVSFRSVVVPLKAIVLNLLSTGAAYGSMVLVFQQGMGASLFGFRQVALIEAWIPLFLFTILYGLSMDYHVFLLSRIREHFEASGDNTQAVIRGVGSTTGIITGAALIMVAIFAGFASGELVMFQQIGFGLGVAILLDATLVRSVLLPSAMILLGKRNWYLPTWLAWLPRL